MFIRAIFLAGLLLFPAMACCAENSEDSAWGTFIKESDAQYGEKDPNDFEDQLYMAAISSKSKSEAIEKFSDYFKLDYERGATYANLIVKAVNYFSDCDNGCPFSDDQELYKEIKAVANEEITGRLYVSIGHMISDKPSSIAFIRLVWPHPNAAYIFSKMYDYSVDNQYLAATLQSLPNDPGFAPEDALENISLTDTSDSEFAYLLAIEEHTEKRLGHGANAEIWRKEVRKEFLTQLLFLGMNAEAVKLYASLSQSEKSSLFETHASTQKCANNDLDFDLINMLVAALWLEGKKDEARLLFEQSYSNIQIDSLSGMPSFLMLNDALNPKYTDKQLFELYVEGAVKAHSKAAKDISVPCYKEVIFDSNGWLFIAHNKSPAIRKVIAIRLLNAGYNDMSNWLMSDDEVWARDIKDDLIPLFKDLLPEEIKTQQILWDNRVKAEKSYFSSRTSLIGETHVAVASVQPKWIERPLPEGVLPWGEEDKATKLPKNLKFPNEQGDIIRYEVNGKNEVVIFESSEYDLSGEVSSYGLWVAFKQDGVWERPYYLNLQEHFPYVVTAGSRLPLINGENINLEVQVQEIDKDTITFPPVSLEYKRQKEGIYLEIPIADLKADSDGDGITDIAEAKLGLSATKRDSDGDGVDDGFDPLPLTKYVPNSDPRRNQVAKLILEQFVGHDSGAIVVKPRTGKSDDPLLLAMGKPAPKWDKGTLFLVTDSDIFAGIVDVRWQFIIYSNKDVALLTENSGLFYPPRITNLFVSLDGNSYYVEWSAVWVGGAFVINCNEKKCTSETLSSWIT